MVSLWLSNNHFYLSTNGVSILLTSTNMHGFIIVFFDKRHCVNWHWNHVPSADKNIKGFSELSILLVSHVSKVAPKMFGHSCSLPVLFFLGPGIHSWPFLSIGCVKICLGVLCLSVSDQALQQLKTPLWPRRFFLQLVDWRASVTARWRPKPLKLRPMFLPQKKTGFEFKKKTHKTQIEISLWHANFAAKFGAGAPEPWALRFRCRSHRSQIWIPDGVNEKPCWWIGRMDIEDPTILKNMKYDDFQSSSKFLS